MCMLYSGGSNETGWQFKGKINSPYLCVGVTVWVDENQLTIVNWIPIRRIVL